MKAIQKWTFTNLTELIFFGASSIGIITYLFYVDEGNNSFEVFLNPVHWFVFIIYFVPAFFGMLLFSKWFTYLNIDKGFTKTLISAFFGAILGISIVFGFFYFVY